MIILIIRINNRIDEETKDMPASQLTLTISEIVLFKFNFFMSLNKKINFDSKSYSEFKNKKEIENENEHWQQIPKWNKKENELN